MPWVIAMGGSRISIAFIAECFTCTFWIVTNVSLSRIKWMIESLLCEIRKMVRSITTIPFQPEIESDSKAYGTYASCCIG
jgi:hypothetical protein